MVITLGCADACPPFADKRYEEWSLDTPAGQGVDAARLVRDEIKQRVELLAASMLVE